MKNLLFILLFAISAFAGEINIPKGVGDVDGAVYTADAKTLYTLKNETVTKWSVEPLKQLDTFETTVNHLRDYVSEEIDKNYLEELTKNYKFRAIVLDEKGDELTISSQYVSETWNLKTKKLTFGGPKGTNRIQMKLHRNELKLMLLSKHTNRFYPEVLKPLHSFKISADNKTYCEAYFNPNFKWNRNNQLQYLNIGLLKGTFPKHEVTTVLTMADDISLSYHSILTDQTQKGKEAVHIVATRAFLEKGHLIDPYAEVWETKNAHKAMEKLYGATKSQAFMPNSDIGLITTNGYRVSATYGLDFHSLLIVNSTYNGGYPKPLMILNSDVIDMKTEMDFALLGHQSEWNHGYSEDVNLTIFGQTKEKKVYEWNTFIRGSPGDN
ncbi:MAG: hypothetical protein ACYDD5_10775 [Sulfuricurvum sp.]